MRMQIFRVKKSSCKILKTKNCVPFEVQYTNRPGFAKATHVKIKGRTLIYDRASLEIVI